MGPYPRLLLIFLLPFFFFPLIAGKTGGPSVQWENTALDAAARINSGAFGTDPYLIHPPGYLYLLSFFVPPGGGALESARLFNYACFVLTGWMVFLLGRRLSPSGAAGGGGAAVLLYCTSPLALQGTLLIDLGDTSIVPLAASVYFLALGGSSAAATGVAYAFNLWTKFIHPLFIALAAAASLLFRPRSREDGKRFFAIVAGAVLFLASWVLYSSQAMPAGSRWLPFEYMFGEMFFNYHRSEAASSGALALLYVRAVELARVLLWLWPALLVWGIRLSRKGVGEGAERQMNLFILILLFAAAFTKGTSNGFPKYRAALLPVVSALGGAFVFERAARLFRRPVGPLFALFLLAGLAVFLAGDPILALNYSFRRSMVFGGDLSGPALSLLLRLTAAAACVSFFALFFRREERKDRFLAAVFAGGLAWQASIGLIQWRGDYSTTYGYGTSGKREIVSLLARECPSCRVLAPNEFRLELKAAGLVPETPPDTCWQNDDCLRGRLRDRDNRAFVYGLPTNTVAQLRVLSSLSPDLLSRDFSTDSRGDFTMLLFKSEPRR
jgi:hypothetical protein